MNEIAVKIPVSKSHKNLLKTFHDYFTTKQFGQILRFVVTKTDRQFYHCEIGVLPTSGKTNQRNGESIFSTRVRKFENCSEFNVALVIPTGIGTELGGHAGDAGSVARMIAKCCDNLILHPNVVNASDINEMPENSFYVEGSVLSRLFLGTVGLQKVRSNRVLVIFDDHQLPVFINAAINSVNAARATYGLNCSEIIKLNPAVILRSSYSSSGRAVGEIEGLNNLFKLIEEKSGTFDAIALSSVIKVPKSYHLDYFKSEGSMLNPWGGVEAMLTHAVSHLYNIPSAHSPMFEEIETSEIDPGIVDSRMAAEAVSLTFLQCILKGLHRSPRIITDEAVLTKEGVISAEDISCIVIPDGCLGLPTLAALEQGIPLIAVQGNHNLMRNNLRNLPWKSGQFHIAKNYLEVAGLLASMKAGVSVESVKRPISVAKVSLKKY
jgi:hypothetical protein